MVIGIVIGQFTVAFLSGGSWWFAAIIAIVLMFCALFVVQYVDDQWGR